MAKNKYNIVQIGKNQAAKVVRKSVSHLDNRLDLIENKIEALGMPINRIDTMNRLKRPAIFQASENEIIVKIFTDLKMCLNPKDVSVVPHLALDGIWEHEITYAWLKCLKSDDIVLDVGANFGYFGVLAAQQIDRESGKIVLFEANPKLIPYINKSLSINNYHEHCTIENLAISNQEEKVTLNILKDYIGSSSLHTFDHLDSYIGTKVPVEKDESISVQAVSVDSYCESNKMDRVNLVKMDIEGYEDIAYEGMRKTVKSNKRITLFIEFTKLSYSQPQKFYNQLLADFGFVYTIDSTGAIMKPEDASYEEILGDITDWRMLIFSKDKELSKA